jgi:hypothetical protein
MDKLSPEVLEIFNSIKINTTANLTYKQINTRSFHIINNSCIGQNADETKSLYLNDLKKIINIIGLIKRLLGEPITLLQKITIEFKLIKLLNKLEEILNKYNLNLNNILDSFIESDNLYLKIINSNELVLPGLYYIYLVINRMKIRLETIFLETDENILISNIFDSFLNIIYLKKCLNNYLSIIDINNDSNTFLEISDKIKEIERIIENFVSKNQFIKNYINLNDETKKKIRINIRQNLFNTLFIKN